MLPPTPPPSTAPCLFLVQEILLRRPPPQAKGRCSAAWTTQDWISQDDVAVHGRLDHFTYDAAEKIMYLACLGDNSVAAVDAFTGGVLECIQGKARSVKDQRGHYLHPFDVAQPQGLLFVPETQRLYVANAADGNLHAFKRTRRGTGRGAFVHELEHTFGFGASADNLRYADGRVFVGTADAIVSMPDAADLSAGSGGSSVTEMTEEALRARGAVRGALRGDPESFQLESGGLRRIFVNVADARAVQVLASDTGETLAEWALPEGLDGNFPMALDEAGGTLFVGVRKPTAQACVLALSTDDGAVKARVPCAADCDDLCFDAARRRVYAVGGVGRVTVIDAAACTVLGEHETALGARTGFWYAERDALYVAAPATAAAQARLLVFHGD
jgi:hypothetical protein